MVGALNINSVRNKFDQLKHVIGENLDILLIGETKLDDTFPDGQFFLNGFLPPFRKDRNKHGGGIMILVKEQIPVKIVETKLPNDIESLFLELNFKNS